MLHRKFFWLLLLLLPIQLGKHFWPDFSLVFGIRVDYLSPTVYLTDVVVVVLLALWVAEIGWIRGIRRIRKVGLIPLFLLFLLVPSFLVAQNHGAAIYKSIKILEFVLLGIYICFNSLWILKNRAFAVPLSLAVIYTSTITFLQFFKQSSLGGVFWFLGERTFTAGSPGIALANFFGQEFLRPYSTFPHPNALAGFLLVSVLLQYPWKAFFEKCALILAVVGILISFSQGAWIAAAAVFCFWVAKKIPGAAPFFTGFLVGGIIFITVLPVLLAPSFSVNFPQEIQVRHHLGWAAGQMVKDYPVFGVGINNFVNRLPEYGLSPTISWWLQPAHNIFLLIAAEMGLVGLGVFLWLVYKSIARAEGLILALFAILITGSLDHYWVTLQQTQALMAIVFGLSLGYTRKTRDVSNHY